MRIKAALILLIMTPAVFGQAAGTPAAKVPEFEVAEIKVNKSVNPGQGKARVLPGGRFEMPNSTIKRLIVAAYNVHESTITGGPPWLESDRFDIVAKAPPGTPRETLFLMLQSLLAERFKLTIHREERPLTVYALVVGKGGPRLQKPSGGEMTCDWIMPGNGRVQRECKNMTMRELASSIPNWAMAHVDVPVVDLTDIQGAYDFRMEWSVPANPGAEGRGDVPITTDNGGATLFDAMSQIGLKLERRKHPISVIVIDHVDRLPTVN